MRIRGSYVQELNLRPIAQSSEDLYSSEICRLNASLPLHSPIPGLFGFCHRPWFDTAFPSPQAKKQGLEISSLFRMADPLCKKVPSQIKVL